MHSQLGLLDTVPNVKYCPCNCKRPRIDIELDFSSDINPEIDMSDNMKVSMEEE